MQEKEEIAVLRQELETLYRDYHKLSLEHKKTVRALDLAEKQIERNRISAEAKDNLGKAISAKRSELERYMNLLLGNCPDMILLFDKTGRIVYCTESYLSLCRIPGFGMIRGASCEELLDRYAAPAFREQMQKVFSSVYEQKQAIGFSATADFGGTNNPRSYNIQVTPMLSEGKAVEGAMIILSDTTDILQAQREAERANAAKSDFLATVSHEIRTPMNAIIGIAGMLKSTGLDKQQHEYLRNIQDSSHVLLNLINDVLDFSKIDAGKFVLIPEYFCLGAQLKHLQTMFGLMFQQKALTFVCEFADDLPEVVYGDDKRIRQILTNILNNALKYTKRGSVWFSVFRQPDGTLGFSVKDTGIGIRQDAIPRIFSAFEQLDLTQNKRIVGTGLGLAITKRLCDLMGGSIEVESTYGEGSCFTVSLSLREGTLSDLPPEERTEITGVKTVGVKALLVDDIEINLQVAAYLLELFEIEADFALNGKQAIEKVSNNRYDIIFMDHMMPEMDGVEATAIIRTLSEDSAKVPIVALTANAVSSAVEMFYENGFSDFLSKPIDEAALLQCLLKWLPEDKVILSFDETRQEER